AADLARRIELAATARLGLEAATGERARRAELVAERAGLLAELADVAARAEEHRVDHAKQAEAHQALEQARTDARALLDTRRCTLDAARTHLARRRDQVERDALHERLRRLADADARRLAAIGVIESIAVDDAVLDRLRTAEVERRVAETTLGAASALVSLTAARAVEVHTDGHTVALAEGDTTEWQVSAPRSLHIDGLGRLDVVPGAGTEELASRAVEAATELATLLAGARVADMGAAEAAHRRRTAAERDLATAEADVAAALAGESADGLRARLAVLEARTTGVVPGDVEVGASAPIDLEAAEAAVREAEATIAPADAELARIDHELARVRAERERLQVELAGLEATLASVEQRDRAVDTQLGEARAERPDAELDAAVTEAVAAHAAAEAEVAAAEARLAAADPDTVAATADNAAAVVADLRARLADEATELTTRRARLELAGGSGLHERREHLAAELHHAEAELAALTARAAAARRLVDTLDRHRAELHRRYAAPLRTTVESYGRLVHGPGFSVELDESLTIERRILDGIGLDVDQLSVGAREQLALLTRLACATLVGPEGGVVWLDDALGNTDPDRLDALGPVLRAAGQRCQVVVLTCSPERYRLVGGAHRVRLHA
ncbi:MAG TPA: hypothetical protein VK866_12350, partial [Acidimicrobiales bacterium]|nr:hypothetical protein [Acidimicrobiales bacterium]